MDTPSQPQPSPQPLPFYLNTVDDPIPRRVYVEHVLECSQYDATQLVELMLLISTNRLTGSLTINFTQGTIAGGVEFRQKVIGDKAPGENV